MDLMGDAFILGFIKQLDTSQKVTKFSCVYFVILSLLSVHLIILREFLAALAMNFQLAVHKKIINLSPFH